MARFSDPGISPRIIRLLVAAGLLLAWPAGPARAQGGGPDAGAATSDPAAAPSPQGSPSPDAGASSAAPGTDGGTDGGQVDGEQMGGDGGATPPRASAPPSPIPALPQPAEPPAVTERFIPLPPTASGEPPPPLRRKPLKITVGIPPTTSDLGSETDVTRGDSTGVDVLETQSWTLNVRAYLRAPLRISLGPRDDSFPTMPSGHELHSPPRMVGLSSSNWAYIAVAQNPFGALRTTIGNARASASLIFSTSTFPGVGYDDVDSLGGMAQGYITLRFPDAFGSRGGVALIAGAFSNSYGTAGPQQRNTGFYGTYLFGRIHQTGETLTANYDLTDRWELLVEHGIGAKLDLLPFLPNAPKQMFIPGNPNTALGSNFVHHAHVALRADDWLKIGAHYMTSWESDAKDGPARLSTTGADIHIDDERWGSFYIGYSHVWGYNLMPLDNALQVIHGSRGYDFKLQYFGNKLRQYAGSGAYLPNKSGRVETVLFQYTLRSYELLRTAPSFRGRDAKLSFYGMFSHAYSPSTGNAQDMPAGDLSGLRGPFVVNDNKLKFGSLLELALFTNLSLNLRFDRVQPTQMDPQQSYTAFTGQLIIRSGWRSSRQILIGYTHFLLGAHDYPDSPYSASYKQADSNLLVVSAIMSL